jgi:glycosyltransferase involved in cell wall biosynthesis
MRERSILLLHPSDEAYGSDRTLLRNAVRLHQRGWRVRILVSDDQPPGWLTEQARAAGIPVGRGPLAPARRLYLSIGQLVAYWWRLLEARRWIRQEVDSFEPSVVLVDTSALLVGGLIGRPKGIRLVWHIHEIVVEPVLASWIFRLMPSLTGDLVLAVSKSARLHLTPFRFRRSRVVTLWNYIGPRPRRSPVRQQPPLVACVGRLNRWKGYEVLVAAAALLADELPDLRFAIVGSAPPGEEWRTDALRREVERLGLTDRFELTGFVDDGPSVFERATIAVVPSVWPEPFGLVTLEAMRAGTPVIATAHGGSREIVQAGKSGLLVPPGDPYALAGAIRRLMLDPELRDRLSEGGLRRVSEGFSPERLQERLDRVLTGILQDGPPGAPDAVRLAR